MPQLGTATMFCLVLVYSAFMRGWAASILWGWFIVKKFDAPGLSIPEAIGIMLLVSFVSATAPVKKKIDESWLELMIETSALVTLQVILVLVIGALVRLFI